MSIAKLTQFVFIKITFIVQTLVFFEIAREKEGGMSGGISVIAVTVS